LIIKIAKKDLWSAILLSRDHRWCRCGR